MWPARQYWQCVESCPLDTSPNGTANTYLIPIPTSVPDTVKILREDFGHLGISKSHTKLPSMTPAPHSDSTIFMLRLAPRYGLSPCSQLPWWPPWPCQKKATNSLRSGSIKWENWPCLCHDGIQLAFHGFFFEVHDLLCTSLCVWGSLSGKPSPNSNKKI